MIVDYHAHQQVHIWLQLFDLVHEQIMLANEYSNNEYAYVFNSLVDHINRCCYKYLYRDRTTHMFGLW